MFRVNDNLAQILNPLVIELRRSFEYLETILESFGDLEDPEEVPDPQEINVDTLEPMMMALEDAIDKILKLSNDYKKTEDAEKKVEDDILGLQDELQDEEDVVRAYEQDLDEQCE